jgi:hypothetical protein
MVQVSPVEMGEAWLDPPIVHETTRPITAAAAICLISE